MEEFSFIRSIKPDFYRQKTLIKGIDDDAAVFRSSHKDVVTAVDTMVEEVHFSRETMSPGDIGYRAMAANLSDLAAMGSDPAFYLVSMVVPSDWKEDELQELYRGMKQLADCYHMDLIGGDTVSGKELTISITVIGYVDHGKARYRSDAEPGDIVFVTGTLGDSRAGLACMMDEKSESNQSVQFFINRHRRPTPRVEFAQALLPCERLVLNDISDGIANESNEIAESSRVDLHLDFSKLPFTKELKEVYPDDYQEWMLSGGEDFELIGTVPEKDWPEVKKAAEATGVTVSAVGVVKATKDEHPRVFLKDKDKLRILNKSGYTHLKEKGE